jgi:hypothetical protein
MKPINSVISGLVSRAQADANSTGPQHGGRGVATVAVRAKLESQAANGNRSKPTGMAGILAERRRQASIQDDVPAGGWVSIARTTGFRVSGLTPENRETARQAVQSAMTRPPLDKCEEWVAGLHAVTARRGDDTATLDLTMSLYAACLAKYPADVAKGACMTSP